jgi:hypothetical protein
MTYKKGTFVLVRTMGAGVHFGTLEEKEGQSVRLSNSRRLWQWSGALSLSEIATKGVTISASKISVPVEEIILDTCIEVIKVSETSNLPGNESTRKNISAKV